MKTAKNMFKFVPPTQFSRGDVEFIPRHEADSSGWVARFTTNRRFADQSEADAWLLRVSEAVGRMDPAEDKMRQQIKEQIFGQITGQFEDQTRQQIQAQFSRPTVPVVARKRRHFYAIELVCSEKHKARCVVHQFRKKSKRDEWVSLSSTAEARYRYREVLLTSDPSGIVQKEREAGRIVQEWKE
jgi:hypothetical protein